MLPFEPGVVARAQKSSAKGIPDPSQTLGRGPNDGKRRTSERSEYLDRACGENQRLRRRIEELLAAAEGVDSLLDLPETAGVTQVGDGPTAAGRLIGNHKRQRKRPRIAIPINRVFPRRFEAISIGSS